MKKLTFAMLAVIFAMLAGCASMGDVQGTAAQDSGPFGTQVDTLDD